MDGKDYYLNSNSGLGPAPGSRSGQMNTFHNPSNVYANNTSYGFRDQAGFYNNFRESGVNSGMMRNGNGQGQNIFGGGMRATNGFASGSQDR